MGDWFLGLITGILLTSIVGWACLRRRSPMMNWREDKRGELNTKDQGNPDGQAEDKDEPTESEFAGNDER